MMKPKLEQILEAILLTAEKPLSVEQLEGYFDEADPVSRKAIRSALVVLSERCTDRSFELQETASGFRLQTRQEYREWVMKHSEEKPPKYSRAMLETLALIAWRQPITRAEIEEIRGVGINATIIKTLQEREWIRVLGHKEVPGRPELLGTTRQFLDYFNLKTLDDLPSMHDIKNLNFDDMQLELLSDTDAAE